MRLRITNESERPDSEVIPYIKLAAHCVRVTGRIHARVYNVRRGAWRWYYGYARYGINRKIEVGMPREGYFKPFERTTLGYFRQHCIPLKKPYRVETWQELLVGIAAHEFAHHMPRGHYGRKSRYELFCEERCAEAIEFMRTEEGRAFIARELAQDHAKIMSLVQRSREELAKRAWKQTDDAKLLRLQAQQKRWVAKQRRATNALKKLARRIKHLQRKAEKKGFDSIAITDNVAGTQ